MRLPPVPPRPAMHLLHLEDCVLDAELLASVLRREWPDCSIRRVATRSEYERALSQGAFDLILSDYSLPEFDGLTALALAKVAVPNKPFIFVSGTIGEERAVEAFQQGASDYIIKDRPQRIVQAIRQAIARVEVAARQRRDDQRIREQAALLDHTRDAICVVDEAQRVTYWNTSAARLLGVAPADAYGRRLDELLFAHEPQAAVAALATALGQGEATAELRPRSVHGRGLIVDSYWTRIEGAEGGASKVLLIMTDMTERRRLETEILRAQRMESIGMFSGAIAHDLNNLLTPILMGIGLLRTQAPAVATLPVLTSMETGAEHGAALVRQLLAFARGADGTRVRVDVATTMASLKRLLRQSLPGQIELQVNLAPDLWPIHADVTQFSQVLLNLCINSRDAIQGQGRVTITVSNVELAAVIAPPDFAAEPGRYLRVSVHDTGSGIPPETIPKIFDPFFTTKALGQGTGLGLSSIVAILKGHHGFVTVESEPGAGATFHVYFPALTEPPPALATDN
jgi:two-component system, cell cycle sensor histidine kinase and response regulator CckA